MAFLVFTPEISFSSAAGHRSKKSDLSLPPVNHVRQSDQGNQY